MSANNGMTGDWKMLIQRDL